MLSESDLNYFNITNSIVQKRLLEEIFVLKLNTARGNFIVSNYLLFYSNLLTTYSTLVAIPDDRYRFAIIKDVLLPVASDQLHKFRCIYIYSIDVYFY